MRANSLRTGRPRGGLASDCAGPVVPSRASDRAAAEALPAAGATSIGAASQIFRTRNAEAGTMADWKRGIDMRDRAQPAHRGTCAAGLDRGDAVGRRRGWTGRSGEGGCGAAASGRTGGRDHRGRRGAGARDRRRARRRSRLAPRLRGAERGRARSDGGSDGARLLQPSQRAAGERGQRPRADRLRPRHGDAAGAAGAGLGVAARRLFLLERRDHRRGAGGRGADGQGLGDGRGGRSCSRRSG